VEGLQALLEHVSVIISAVHQCLARHLRVQIEWVKGADPASRSATASAAGAEETYIILHGLARRVELGVVGATTRRVDQTTCING